MVTDVLISRLVSAPLRVSSADRHPVPTSLRMDWDVHEGLEIAFHRSGEGVVEFAGGGVNAFGPGAIEIYSAKLAHKQTMRVAGEDWFFRVAPMSDLPGLAALDGLSLNLDGPPDACVVQDFAALTDPCDHASRLARAERDHRATALMLRLLGRARPFQTVTADRDASDVPPTSRLADEARRLIRERAATLGRVEAIADELCVSHAHLRHVYKRAHGRSLVRELMEARVELAERELRATRDPLAVIARRAGFESEGYLCRVFRRLRGRSPGSLRGT